MRICLSLIVAAFIFAFCTAASAAPIARAYVTLVCKAEDTALTIANMDQNDTDAAVMMVNQFIEAGGCLYDQRGAWAMLADKIYEYDDAAGKPSGVWRLHGFDGWVIIWDKAVRYIGKES